MKLEDITPGMTVHLHIWLGSKHDGKKYRVQSLTTLNGRPAAVLEGLEGNVYITHLSAPVPGFGLVDDGMGGWDGQHHH